MFRKRAHTDGERAPLRRGVDHHPDDLRIFSVVKDVGDSERPNVVHRSKGVGVDQFLPRVCEGGKESQQSDEQHDRRLSDVRCWAHGLADNQCASFLGNVCPRRVSVVPKSETGNGKTYGNSRAGLDPENVARSGGCILLVEQACNIFYILHRILYFLPEVRGEGTCGGGREERSVNHIA